MSALLAPRTGAVRVVHDVGAAPPATMAERASSHANEKGLPPNRRASLSLYRLAD
jgi:hypothetical protein